MIEWLSLRLVGWIGLAVAVFLGGMATHKAFSDKTIAKLKLEQQTQIAEWQRKVAESESDARQREKELQGAVDKARGELNESLAKIEQQARAIVRLRTDRDQLHNDLSAFAASNPATDSLAACVDRAGRLAGLLAEGDGLVAEGVNLAGEASRAAAVNGKLFATCISAWPKNATIDRLSR